jgi:hypothetical protein
MKKSTLISTSILSVLLLCSQSYQTIVAEENISIQNQINNKISIEINSGIGITSENIDAILQFYFGVQNKTLYLKNIGNETAYNISISIQLDGFIIFGFGNSGFLLGINALKPGEEKNIIKIFPLVLGLGPINITYEAFSLNADSTSITLRGTLIGFFIFNIRL